MVIRTFANTGGQVCRRRRGGQFLERRIRCGGLEPHLAGIADQVDLTDNLTAIIVAMTKGLVVGGLLEQIHQKGEADEGGVGGGIGREKVRFQGASPRSWIVIFPNIAHGMRKVSEA
jgi:hypothetical protein